MRANRIRQSIATIALFAAGWLINHAFSAWNGFALVAAPTLFLLGAMLIDTLRQKADRWDE